MQADVSCHVLPLCQISWPSDHDFYRLSDPYLPSPGPSRSFSPRTAGAIGLLRLGRRGLFPGHSLNGRYGQTEEGRRLKLGRQFPSLPLSLPTEFQSPPFIPSSVGLIFVLLVNFEPPPQVNGWREHVGFWSEVVSGDEGSVYQIWSKSKIPFDVRSLAYLFSRSRQA